jgi:deoxyribonuclease V
VGGTPPGAVSRGQVYSRAVAAWVPPSDFASLTLAQAMALQENLAGRVLEEGEPAPARLAAGADAAYDRREAWTWAVVALWETATARVVEIATASRRTGSPYVPGLFAWRELPALLAAWRRLERSPDLLLVDGHGRAHPRRCGIACLLGLALDVPTIGCARSVLVGSYAGLPPERGSSVPLVDRGEAVGAALRTRSGVRPMFVSVGHRVSLRGACANVLAASRVRVPEPLRAAHAAAVKLAASGADP